MSKWILTSERLPEKDKDVLAVFVGWDDMKFQRVLFYDDEESTWYDWSTTEHDKVIAWQPLPDDDTLKAY